MELRRATPDDAVAIAAVRNRANEDLTARFGQGHWSGHCTDRGVLFDQRHAQVFVAVQAREIVATWVLATKKPWAIDRSYFTPVKRPLYLINMAVAPAHQRHGIGRKCVEHAVAATKAFPAGALWLDAYDHAAGAGEFYRRCGFREVGRAKFRTSKLIYFEWLIP